MNRRRRTRSVLVRIAPALATALAACKHAPVSVPTRNADVVAVGQLGSLHQTVRFEPAHPHSGDTVTVTSVVANRGSDAVDVWALYDLQMSGTLVLGIPDVRLRGRFTSRLAPGDSVVDREKRVVVSSPGHYTVRVVQLVKPVLTATGEVVVGERRR